MKPTPKNYTNNYKIQYNKETELVEILDRESRVLVSLPKQDALEFTFDIEWKIYQAVPKEPNYNGVF